MVSRKICYNGIGSDKLNTLLENVMVGNQNTIRIDDLYFDPFRVEGEPHDARMIFITHSHYDHYSEEDIAKVRNQDTILVAPHDCLGKALDEFDKNHILIVEPNQEYTIGDAHIKTIPMYNEEKAFHPKANRWVGYLLTYNDITYYIVGDSDATEELCQTKCDVLFIPIGGTYTMDVEEALEATRKIKPKVVVPTHYGVIVGTREDGLRFQAAIEKEIPCQLYQGNNV